MKFQAFVSALLLIVFVFSVRIGTVVEVQYRAPKVVRFLGHKSGVEIWIRIQTISRYLQALRA